MPSTWQATISPTSDRRGTFICSRVVLRSMIERGFGRIINVASNAGAHRWPYFTAYAVSKAAVISQ